MDFTLSNAATIFPDGTSVAVYTLDSQPSELTNEPVGTPVTSATVTSGAVTFTGLTSLTRYVAAAQVGGSWRRIIFTPGQDSLPDQSSGTVGGVLSGSLPNPDFAVDMATQAELDAGLTGKEDVANKDTDGTLAANSDTKYPSQKAAKTYADTKLPASYLDTDGTLAANSDAKVPSQKATKTYADTKVPSSYLDTDGTLAANSDSKVATQKATKTYADTKLPSSYLDTDGTLAANSNTKIASQAATKTYADTKIAKSLVDAKGDLLTATADDTPARFPIGSDGQRLEADSSAASGLAWRTLGAGVGSLELFGHSLFSYGTSNYGATLGHRIAALMGMDLIDHSASGALAARAEGAAGKGGWAEVYRSVAPASGTAPYRPQRDYAAVWYGLNDIPVLGPGLTAFSNALEAILSRLNAAQVFEENHSSIAYGGAGWTRNTSVATAPDYRASGNSHETNTNASRTITISVPSDFPGGAIAASFLCDTNGYGALWDITVDGAGAGQIDTRDIQPQDYVTGANDYWGVKIKRFTGLAAGAHTIVFTTNTVNNTAYFDCWWIEAAASECPLIGVPLQYKPVSYSTWASSPYPIGASDIDTLNTAISAVVANFSNAFTIATEATINGASSLLIADGVHPNDQGYAALAKTIVDAFSAQARSRAQRAGGSVQQPFLSRFPTYAARNYLQPMVGATVPLTIRKALAGNQSVNLTDWQTEAGAALVSIDKDGKIVWGGGATLYDLVGILISAGAFTGLSTITASDWIGAKAGTANEVRIGVDGGSASPAISFGSSLTESIKRTATGVMVANGKLLQKNPSCRVKFTSAQSIPNATWTRFKFDGTEDWDNDSFHDPASNPSRITIPRAGVYSIVATIQWASGSTGYRELALILGGTWTGDAWAFGGTVITSDTKVNSASAMWHKVADHYKFAANDVLEVMGIQNNGAALNASSGTIAVSYLSDGT